MSTPRAHIPRVSASAATPSRLEAAISSNVNRTTTTKEDTTRNDTQIRVATTTAKAIQPARGTDPDRTITAKAEVLGASKDIRRCVNHREITPKSTETIPGARQIVTRRAITRQIKADMPTAAADIQIAKQEVFPIRIGTIKPRILGIKMPGTAGRKVGDTHLDKMAVHSAPKAFHPMGDLRGGAKIPTMITACNARTDAPPSMEIFASIVKTNTEVQMLPTRPKERANAKASARGQAR